MFHTEGGVPLDFPFHAQVPSSSFVDPGLSELTPNTWSSYPRVGSGPRPAKLHLHAWCVGGTAYARAVASGCALARGVWAECVSSGTRYCVICDARRNEQIHPLNGRPRTRLVN